MLMNNDISVGSVLDGSAVVVDAVVSAVVLGCCEGCFDVHEASTDTIKRLTTIILSILVIFEFFMFFLLI
jgi:hypothetical protein